MGVLCCLIGKMALAGGAALCSPLLKASYQGLSSQSASKMSTLRNMAASRKALLGALGIFGGGAVGLATALNNSVKASGFDLHTVEFPWTHSGYFSSLDHASIRRGYEVYKNVCCVPLHALSGLPQPHRCVPHGTRS